MKLFELLGIKSQKDKDLVQLLKVISGDSSKLKKAGDGVAAQVFAHEDGTIYKFWAKDSAYEKFIEFVEKNQSDKHLPKLKSRVKELTAFFKKPKDFPDKVKYVKLEKLTPINHDTFITGSRNIYITDVVESIFRFIEEGNQFEELISDFEIDEDGELEKDTIDVISSLWETVRKLSKISGFKQMRTDIHSGNIMRRGGTFVITDPVVNDADVTFNKTLLSQVKRLSRSYGGTGEID